MDTDEPTRETRLGRAAARQGLRLSKSAQRDPNASDYGKYRVVDASRDPASISHDSPFDYTLDLDGVEDILDPNRHGSPEHPLARDEDFENAITPHAPHDGNWRRINRTT